MSSHSMGLFYHLSALAYPIYPISCLLNLVFSHAHVIATSGSSLRGDTRVAA